MLCLWEQCNLISFSSVIWWCKKLQSGVDSVKDVPHARRPKNATSPIMVEKVKLKIVCYRCEIYNWYIAIFVSISVGAAYTSLSRDSNMR
jgi:hypothetical protein